MSRVPVAPSGVAIPDDALVVMQVDGRPVLFRYSDFAVSGDGTGDMLKSVYDTNNDGKVNAASVADSANAVSWSNVSGKPSTFTPSAHVHAASDVTSGTFADARVSESSVTQHEAALSIAIGQVSGFTDNSANWDAAFGWGDHASEGYITGYTVTEGDVTAHESALTITESQISDLGAYLTDITGQNVVDTADWPSGLDVTELGYLNGVSSAIQTQIDGKAASSHSHTLSDITDAGTAAAAATGDFATAAQGTKADTAHGWGDHGAAGYLTGITGQSIEALSDVNTMTPTDGQVFTWDGANSRWDAADAASGGGKTAATLTHTAGAIPLDVQAADVFRFEADEYTSGDAPTVVAAARYRQVGDFTIPGPAIEDDVVLLFVGGFGPLSAPSGWSEVYLKTTGTIRSGIYSKRMTSTPDTTIDISTFSSNANEEFHIFVLRGVADDAILDVPIQTNLDVNANTNPPSITTSSNNALIIAATIDVHGGYSSQTLPGYTKTPGTAQYIHSWRKELASAGTEDPAEIASTLRSHNDFTMAVKPPTGSGEKDYTFTFSNIPASGIASGKIDIELKTNTGTVAFAGGTVSWRGQVPAFNEVGHYLIGFDADASGITLWRIA